MKCDSTQSGSVSECPTCFQKIVVPQAPASDDPKFILTGAKFTEKKISSTLANAAAASAQAVPEKSFPLIVVMVLALVLAAGAAVFVFRDRLFKSDKPVPSNHGVTVTNAAPKPQPKPVVAPPANDTNWLLTLDNAVIPSATAAGRIHGQDFIIERAYFQNGTLTLRAGTKGKIEFGVQINFSGSTPELLAGKNLDILADTNKSARVTLHWKDDTGAVQKNSYDINYAMRLEFGALAKGKLPGKIYLCTPDAEKSYVMGTFNAVVTKPKPPPAQPPK
jgi:hypothetical protein